MRKPDERNILLAENVSAIQGNIAMNAVQTAWMRNCQLNLANDRVYPQNSKQKFGRQ